jgi:soluble P-type ATPase
MTKEDLRKIEAEHDANIAVVIASGDRLREARERLRETEHN